MLNAGSLNTRVTLKRRTPGRDGAGQPLTTWTNLIASGDPDLWANVRHLSGLESIKADEQASVVKASIRLRWRTDVTPAMRAYVGATPYEIKAVLPDEIGHEYIDLSCERVNG